ncbi:hypothetical protein BT96DRAFT_406784 [Gymnopus androsaceus JB14]|uniref:Protein kinase domain-containing protein n=1 Tax=Gymnopus androsaceus JB14 TaxID=1447944 RepID=A0A6A4GU31_9AGAR|nr:hypothetical protein BT96DRAFT_406784 [Gymnopus androsaceus JB14]
MSRHHPYGARENRRAGSSKETAGPQSRGLRGHTDFPANTSRGENFHRQDYSSSIYSNIQAGVGAVESALRPESRTVSITTKVFDRDGQIQAHLERSTSGVWSIQPMDSLDPLTVKFDDPSFREILASKQPWNHVEWSTPSRINVLLELLHCESKLSTADDFKFKLFRYTRRIAREFETLPSSICLRGLTREGNHPKWGGGYADIWKGQAASGDPICLKVLRVFTTEASKKQLFKEFSQEALVWSQLEHPNVLPFLGTNTDLFPESYCLVSPWCSHGNVMVYLSTHPEADKMRIILDILKGTEYLHSRNPPVVHGDLKGSNILVANLGQCCLADFGLAGMMSTLQTLSSSTGNGTRGSVRWMAPELFDYTTNSKPSTVTDMYSLGCTIYEIVTGLPPFSEVKPDIAVSMGVVKGARPLRPVEGFSDQLWTAIEKCWVDPHNRHTVKTFMDELSPVLLAGSFTPNTHRRVASQQLASPATTVVRLSPITGSRFGRSYNAVLYDDPTEQFSQNYVLPPQWFSANTTHPHHRVAFLVPPRQQLSPPGPPPTTAVRLPPTQASTFGRSYTAVLPTDEMDQIFFASVNDATHRMAPFLFANGVLDELANHYVTTVAALQYYQLADQVTVFKILFDAVEKEGFARHTARLLASVHIQRSQTPGTPVLGDVSVRERYDELLSIFSFAKQRFDDDDALGALNIISMFLFDGGHGDWERWLQVASIYSNSILGDRSRFHGYRDALMNCSDKERFIIKTTFWFDVLASVTTMSSPNFVNVIDNLYNPSNQSGVYDVSEDSDSLSMLSVMGCENRIVWALAKTSQLYVWKQAREKEDGLSFIELSRRAADIESFLTPPNPPLASCTDDNVALALASEVFCTSIVVYLRTIVSGDRPRVPDISKAVADAIASLEKVCTAPESVRHVVVRSTIFAVFICAALTTNANKRSFLLRQLEDQGSVGSCCSI